MKKALRFLSLVLCVLLLFGLTAAQAELITLGISLTGVISEGDGSVRTVTPEGSFRVYQNGREIGEIAAGRETLTVNNTDRIRIEPMPQTFDPAWDLSTAYLTPDVSGSGSVIVPVTLYAQGTGHDTVPVINEIPPENLVTAAPAATQVPTEEPAAETQAPEGAPEETETAPAEIPATAVPVTAEPTQAPTDTPAPTAEPAPAVPEVTEAPVLVLDPYTAPAATPEPVPAGIPAGSETGSVRVQVFTDRNADGSQGGNERGVRDITVYLLNEAAEPLARVETDADGFAVFENVPAGKYRTMVVLPDECYFQNYGGEGSLGLSAFGLLNQGSQTSNVLQVNAGEEAVQGCGIHTNAVVLKGFCWLDETVDGLYKEGEQKIPGTVIKLQSDEKDHLYYETVTGEDGSWKIAHLHPGQYTVTTVPRDGLMITRYTQESGVRSFISGDNRSRQFLADSQGSVNFGYCWASRIYGRCYLDANYNGLYDEGETVLAGVKVSVKKNYEEKPIASVVSAEDGTYMIDMLRGGRDYYIVATLPEGGYVFTRTYKEHPLGNRFAARGDARAYEFSFFLKETERVEMNIGSIIPATIKGTVYYDDNFSASLDGKERIVSGFLVTLVDAQGNTVAQDKANGNGVYELANITPGTYSLEVNAVRGYAFTKRGEGNIILNRTAGSGYSEPFRVELGANLTGMDIGMILPGTVKGSVFADRNDNGIRDNGEGGMTGTTVRLVSEEEGEAFRAEIREDGSFLFDAVMPGRYYVEYTLPESAVFARVKDGGNRISGNGRTGRTDSFDFATGDMREAPVCGALTLGRIEGIAFQDHDGNGLMENEETLSGMNVWLIPSREELEKIAVMTGEDGTFVLDDLRPDVYQLEFSCPEGYVMSRTDHLAIPLKAGLQGQSISLDVQMGDKWTGQMVGAVIPAAISGQLWLDENNNGLFDDGERTPAGYTVIVLDDETGEVFDSPVTDENGRFSAAGMIPGSFTVSLPMDERTKAPKAGDSLFRESDGALVLSGIVLKEDEERDGLLLGVVRTTSIGGHAWIDRGGSIESLGGMKIAMKDADGNLLAETETDEEGNYRINGLMPCNFRLEVTAPEGCVIIEPDDPRLTGSLRSAPVQTNNRLGSTMETELKMDVDINDLDIGCVLPGRLGDYCWVDLNQDGLQAGNEPGIPYVKIELMRDGVTIAETVTDQYGFYRFVDLYPATYIMKVYSPAEVKPTRRRTDLKIISSVLEETDEDIAYSIPITVESNREEYDADLGFVCRKNGVLPAGAGEGAVQDWTPKY